MLEKYLPELINTVSQYYIFNNVALINKPIVHVSKYYDFIHELDLDQSAILINNDSSRIKFGSDTILYFHYPFLYTYLVIDKNLELFKFIIKQAILSNRTYWINNIFANMIQDEYIQNFALARQLHRVNELKKILTKNERTIYINTLIKSFFPLNQWPPVIYKPIILEQFKQLAKTNVYKYLTNNDNLLILNSFLNELKDIPLDYLDTYLEVIMNIINNWNIQLDDNIKEQLKLQTDIILKKRSHYPRQIKFYETLKSIIFTLEEQEKYNKKIAKKAILYIAKRN